MTLSGNENWLVNVYKLYLCSLITSVSLNIDIGDIWIVPFVDGRVLKEMMSIVCAEGLINLLVRISIVSAWTSTSIDSVIGNECVLCVNQLLGHAILHSWLLVFFFVNV